MGIECGQGGLRIDKGPLQRCAYWDLGEEVCVGGGVYIWALDVVCFTSLMGGLTPRERRDAQTEETH